MLLMAMKQQQLDFQTGEPSNAAAIMYWYQDQENIRHQNMKPLTLMHIQQTFTELQMVMNANKILTAHGPIHPNVI